MKAPLHYLVLKVSLLVFLIRPEVSLSNSYITDIGDLGGPYTTNPIVSRDGRSVIGSSYTSLSNDPRRAFLWSEIGGMSHLDGLDGGYSIATHVNHNGNVVVGRATTSGFNTTAFYWTPSGGMVDLGNLGASYTKATGLSSDGSVVIGTSATNTNLDKGITHKAFRWTQENGMVDLGYLGGDWSEAIGVSANGDVIIGHSLLSDGYQRAFRWTQETGMIDLGDLGGGTSEVIGISDDGGVIIGSTSTSKSAQYSRGFYWTENTGMVDLGSLGKPTWSSPKLTPSHINKDGSVIFGNSTTAKDTYNIFRWTKVDGLIDLGISGAVKDISSNGNVAVGMLDFDYLDPLHYIPFRWSSEGGVQSIEEWLQNNGISINKGLSINSVDSMSDDGNTIVGTLENLRSYIARVDSIGEGLISDKDMRQSLLSSSIAIDSTLRTTNTLINGAHSHPMGYRVPKEKSTFWVSGDLGEDKHQGSDSNFSIAELGVGYNYGPIQLNLSLGNTWSEQNLIFSGEIDSEGTYLMLEAIIPVSEKHALFATVGTFGHWADVDIRRGYLNAGLPDLSIGSSNTTTIGARARLDWINPLFDNGTLLIPYGDFSYSNIAMDSYTEQGGGFPATFHQISEDITEIRIGINTSIPIQNTDIELISGVETAHRLNNTGTQSSGEFIGLFGFDLEGKKYNSTWYKASIGFKGNLGHGNFTFMLNGTTEGAMPSSWLATSYQMTF